MRSPEEDGIRTLHTTVSSTMGVLARGRRDTDPTHDSFVNNGCARQRKTGYGPYTRQFRQQWVCSPEEDGIRTLHTTVSSELSASGTRAYRGYSEVTERENTTTVLFGLTQKLKLRRQIVNRKVQQCRYSFELRRVLYCLPRIV